MVVDNLMNDVRGTRMRPSLLPHKLVRGVDKLREVLRRAGASAVVTCQFKPMQAGDVTPYNSALSKYLEAQRYGFGCRTQIRMSFLKPGGFHIKPQYDSVVDKTYACTIRGVPVVDPTPPEEFVPDHMRHSWQREWPRLGGGAPRRNYGW